MPVYLVHGFRWKRPEIRIHIIIHNLEDAAPEWLVAPGTTRAMLHNFHELYPNIMTSLPNLRFIEQYDPSDETVKGQPYAYVADVVHEVKLSVDIDEIRGKGLPNEQWTALLELRDQLCPAANVAWFIVICGDEERYVPPSASATIDEEDEEEEEEVRTNGHHWGSGKPPSDRSGSAMSSGRAEQEHKLKRSDSIGKGLRKFMGMEKLKETPRPELKQTKSLRSFRSLTSMRSKDQLRVTFANEKEKEKEKEKDNKKSKGKAKVHEKHHRHRSGSSTPESSPPPTRGTAR